MNPISEPILIVQRCQSHCQDFTTHHVITDLAHQLGMGPLSPLRT